MWINFRKLILFVDKAAICCCSKRNFRNFTLNIHGMSFFVACITSESRTELTLNSSSRISRTCETYTDGNALRSGEMSYRNNLKSQTTTNWRTQPFLTPPIFGTLTYPSYAVPIPRVGSIPNGRLAETTHTPFVYLNLLPQQRHFDLILLSKKQNKKD